MSEIVVSPMGPDRFGVEVTDGDLRTNHQVSVPRGLVEDLALQDVEPELLVRESIGFLLEREPATSIMREFGLDVIPRFFPEYSAEIVRRVQSAE